MPGEAGHEVSPAILVEKRVFNGHPMGALEDVQSCSPNHGFFKAAI